MNGNFKVRCIDRGDNHKGYTNGKVYVFKNGLMLNDKGHEMPMSGGINTFEQWQAWSSATWELVTETKEIHIRQKGRKVIAVMTEDGKYVKSANAKCSQDDEFNFNTGAKLAFSRLVGGAYIGGVDMAVDTSREANPFDWEAFEQGKFAVYCDTKEKAKMFLQECDEQGIIWAGGDKASHSTYWDNSYSDGILYFHRYKCLTYSGSIQTYNDETIVEYVVLENYRPEETKPSLSIYTDKELVDELAKRWEDRA